MSLLHEPRAIVTGAGSGLGRAFCLALAAHRAHLVATDVDVASAEETCRLARAAGASGARSVRCDVTVLDDVENLLRFAEDAYGGADLLVNNAGVAAGGRVGETPMADWRWVVDVDLWGVIHGCHVFVPWFRRHGSGAIINVASAAGLICPPMAAPYNVAKAGVIALSETLHAELEGSGVRVTVLCPTFFPTNIVRSSRSIDPRTAAVAEKLMKRSSLDAQAVANAALEAADRGDLYAVPMADGRWLWRLKRLMPKSFYDLAGIAHVRSQARSKARTEGR